MIILRQHNYTFADKKVFRELYKATGGFRHFPKGARNLNARDLVRLQEISGKNGNIFQQLNTEEGKYLLNKMGLHNSAAGIEHLAKKYGNDELASRYRRRFIPKEEINKARRGKNLLFDLNRRRTKSLADIHINYNKTRNRVNSRVDAALDSNYEMWRNGKVSDEVYCQRKNKILNISNKMLEDLSHTRKEKTNKIFDGYSKLENKIQTRYGSKPKQLEKFRDNLQTAHQESVDSLAAHGIIPTSEMGIRREIAKNGKKKTGASIRIKKDSNNFSPETNTISISPGANSFVVGHEYGHAKNYARNKRMGISNNYNRTLGKLSEEAQASSRSLNSGTKYGLSEELGRKELGDAFNTYFQEAAYKEANNLVSRYKLP